MQNLDVSSIKNQAALSNRYPRVGDFVCDVNGSIYKVIEAVNRNRVVGYRYDDEQECELPLHMIKVLVLASPDVSSHLSIFDTVALPEDPWPLDVVYHITGFGVDGSVAISNGRESIYGADQESINHLLINVKSIQKDGELFGVIRG